MLPNKLQIDRRHALFALAVLLLLAGATALILNSDDFRIRSLGVSACVVSAYLVRKSRLSARSILGGETFRDANVGTPQRVGYVTWAVSIILLPRLSSPSFVCTATPFTAIERSGPCICLLRQPPFAVWSGLTWLRD